MSDLRIPDAPQLKISPPPRPKSDRPPIPLMPEVSKLPSIEPLIKELDPVIQATPDPEETTARIHNALNLSDMLDINEKYAYNRQYEIMEQYTGEKTSAKNFWGYWKDSWKASRIHGDMSKIGFQMMQEKDPEKREEYWKQIKEMEGTMPSPDRANRSIPIKLIGDVLPLIQQRKGAIPKSLELAAAWAVAGGSIAFLGGQLGPQVVTPEEVVTVPATMAAGAGYGMAAGMVAHIGELEAAGMYIDLINLGVDHKFAKAAGAGVGIANMMLETVQVGEWLKTIPGAKTMLRRGVGAVSKKLASTRWTKLLKSAPGKIGKAAIKNAVFAGKETVEEVAQEVTAIFGQELAIWMNNRAKQGDEIASQISEALPRMWEVAKRTFGPFFLMGLPGVTATTLLDRPVSEGVGKEDIPLQDIRVKPSVQSFKEFKEEMSKSYAEMGDISRTPADIIQMVKDEELDTISNYDRRTQLEWLGQHTKYFTPDTNGKLTIYRATQGDEIRAGDYVTNDREYAEMHLESILRGEGKVIELEDVGLDELAVVNPNEFWYAPKELQKYKSLEEYYQDVIKEKPKTLVEELETTFADKIHQYAKAMRDRATEAYRTFKQQGLIERIKEQGKIHLRFFKGKEEVADIPKVLKLQIFTKDESAMDMDDMAGALGMTEEELRQGLISYKDEKPSATIADYYEEAQREMPEEGKPEENIVETVVKQGATPVETDVAASYEGLKDQWIGEKDVRARQRDNETIRLQRQLKGDLGYQRVVKRVRDIADAIQIAIDTNRNPGHVAEFWPKLSVEQKTIVQLSQNLPLEALPVLDKIQASYNQTGVEALDEDVIYNLEDNFANRTWDFKGEEISSIRRKFGTKSRHRHPRVFDTIIEGWVAGYELKVTDAIENLNIYKQEITNTILNKRFLKSLMRVRDVDGKPLLTTNPKLAKELEYKQVKHPNFRTWAWQATTDVDIITRNLRTIFEETKKVEKATAEGKKIEAKPIDRLKTIIEESLQMRGYTEGEAQNAIAKVENAPNKEVMYNTIETIERSVVEKEQVMGYNLTPIYGRRSLLTEKGALLEESELYAPKKIAKNLNNILGQSVLLREEAGAVGEVAKVITKYNAVIKSWILQSSFFHHQAYMRSYFLPGIGELKFGDLNLVKAITEGVRAVEEETPDAMLLIRNGLTVGLQQEWDAQLMKENTIIDRWIDKIGATRVIREKIIALRETHTAFLFGTFGAGLKVKRALIELRSQYEKFPNEDPNILAKRVANLINDDFGGLHLQRLGRNPTWQHMMRLFLLAPDWTESNVRSMVKAFKAGSTEERAMYQRFWAGVIIKGAAATTTLNYALAGGDVDEMKKRFEIAWKAGPEKLKWMAVDITPIYEFFGDDIDERKYWYLIGHFRDPFKFAIAPKRSLKHKGSVAFRVIFDALTGTDWAGRRFTTLGELVETGQIVEWGKQKSSIWQWFPSYVLYEIIGSQPVQFQNLLRWMMGEMHGFDAILNSLGFGITSIYEPQLKEIRKEMRR